MGITSTSTKPTQPLKGSKIPTGEHDRVRFGKHQPEGAHPPNTTCSGPVLTDNPPKSQAQPAEAFVPSIDFPAVGPPPPSGPSGNFWHTAADPTQSVGPLGPGSFYNRNGFGPQSFHPAGPGAFPKSAQTGFTFGGPHPFPRFQSQQSRPQGPRMPSDNYQNTFPPRAGVNFQPQVPDTTYGPMYHTYIPRFDGGQPMPVGAPAPYYVMAPASLVHAQPATMQGVTAAGYVMPNTGPYPYLNGIKYLIHPGAPMPMQLAGGGPGYVHAQQPPVVQPMPNQPVMYNGQGYVPFGPPGAPNFQAMPAPVGMVGGGPAAVAGGAPQFMPGNLSPLAGGGPLPGYPKPPDGSGMGHTPGEEQLRQIQFAYNHGLFEPQDFKPADDDPSRFYFVRELDGNWTQRNRFSIDHMGDCRWYVTDDGWFYAVRLAD